MSVLKQVESAMKETMHSVLSTKSEQDKERLKTLKLIKAELVKVNDNNNDYHLTEDEETTVMLSMVKKREKSIEIYKTTDRKDLLAIEENELSIINEFMPSQPTEEEMEKYQRELVDSYVSEQGNGYKISMKDCKPILSKMTEKFPHITGKFVSSVMMKIVKGE